MVNPWLWPLVLLGLGVLAGFAVRATAKPKRPVWVANSANVQRDSVVKSAIMQYNVLRVAGAVALVLLAIASAVLLSRPVHREVAVDKAGTRDIVLCLDVSGSMTDYDVEIVEKFEELIPFMSGERIALVIFNSTARVVFPLTDDYDMITEELQAGAQALSYGTWGGSGSWEDYQNFVAGTEGIDGQASLIPDGLASCALQFDTQPTERSRTIIFATDNDVSGQPIFTLAEATDVAMERQAIVIGLFVGDPNSYDPYYGGIAREFVTETERSGGFSLLLTDPASTQAIIDTITSQQIVDVDTPPRTLENDLTFAWLVLGTIGVLLLIVVGAVVRE